MERRRASHATKGARKRRRRRRKKRRRRWWGTGGSAVATATGRLRVLFDPPHLSSDGGPRR
jgi:hypothetical protein